MEERIRKILLELGGENIQVKESQKSIEKKRKNKFIELVNSLKKINNRAVELNYEFGVNLLFYEDEYFQVIENLINGLYGESVSKVIFWWVYDVDDPKKGDFKIMDEKSGKEYQVKTPSQLYNVTKKLKLFKNL
mgnify:FL=1|jgi:hypothetical protein|tara:strand:- start:18 stop:419 length:402 start_codon:yes stop_codon:yes gene_type:complete